MKTSFLFGFAGLFGLLLTLTGCDTLSSSGSGPFAKVPPQIRTFEVDEKTVFFASQLALKRMSFTLTRTQLAQGRVEAQSSLRNTDVYGAARQFTLKVELSGLGDRHTEVAVLIHEQSEADFKAGATNRALREHGLYDSFFAQLEQALQEQAKKPAAEGD